MSDKSISDSLAGLLVSLVFISCIGLVCLRLLVESYQSCIPTVFLTSFISLVGAVLGLCVVVVCGHKIGVKL